MTESSEKQNASGVFQPQAVATEGEKIRKP
jgi:hypothetical protein